MSANGLPEDPLQDIKQMIFMEIEQKIPSHQIAELEEKAFYGSDQDKANFAVALLHSENPDNQQRGISLLKAVYTSIQKVSQFFSDTDKDLARHCLYQLTLGCYMLKKYQPAVEYGGLLLQITPNHQQAKAILSLINEPTSAVNENGSKKTAKTDSPTTKDSSSSASNRRKPRKAETVNEKKLPSGSRPQFEKDLKAAKQTDKKTQKPQ